MKQGFLLMFLMLCLTTFGVGCSSSDGTATDGDTADGDTSDNVTDGDTEDGDCPECDWVTGTYCVDNMEGDGCALITVNKVVITETEDCKFDVRLQFSDDTEDVVVKVEGCDISGRELFGGMCTFDIKSGDKEISVDCGGCTFDVSEEACITNCDCLVDDACCDGCAAINEDGACDDGNACTETDSCKAGVCTGAGLVACEASDQCHGVGECDVDTGTCTNPLLADDTACDDDDKCTTTDTCQAGMCEGADPVVCEAMDECHEAGVCDSTDGSCSDPEAPNGKACDASDDGSVPGSGICDAGSCTSIGDCSMRTFNQPLGYACNFSEDCESGFCLSSLLFKAGAAMTCTTTCDMDDDQCPDGMECYDLYDEFKEKAASFDIVERFICITGANIGPAAGTGVLYQACNEDEDCESEKCTRFGDVYLCSFDCYDEVAGEPDHAACGDCGTCEEYSPAKDGEKRPTFRCTPDLKKDIGELCTDHRDCDSGLCFMNYCTTDCGALKDVPACPADYTCLYSDVMLGFVCVDDTDIDSVDDGGYCDYGFECGDDSFCDVYDAYMTGSYLFNGEMHHIGGDNFGTKEMVPFLYSNWSFDVEETGTYYLMVPAPWAHKGASIMTNQFHYQGLITTSDATPTDVLEVEPNNDPDNPQAITLPANVIGDMVFPDSYDFYTFDLVEGDVLTVKFLPLTSPSICTPELNFGDACTRHKECAGDYCYDGTCNTICDADAAKLEFGTCPTDYTCVDQVDPMYDLCIPDTNLGKAFGVDCENDFECESDLCFKGACNIECTLIAKGDPILCPDDFTCIDANSDLYNYSHDDKGPGLFPVCMPDSDVGFAFYDDCEFNHQCESFICLDGACNFMCSSSKISPPPCPENYACINYSLDNKASYDDKATFYFCKPEDEVGFGFGDDCELNYECDSGVCFEGTCSETCTFDKAEDDSCVSGYSCTYVPDVGDDICIDDDDLDKSFGEACDYTGQCGELGAKCWQDTCNLWCNTGFDKAPNIECPSNFKCAYIYSSGSKDEKISPTACVSDTEPSLNFYDDCDYGYQCPDNMCYSGKCNMWCSFPVKGDSYCPSGYHCAPEPDKEPSLICYPNE